MERESLEGVYEDLKMDSLSIKRVIGINMHIEKAGLKLLKIFLVYTSDAADDSLRVDLWVLLSMKIAKYIIITLTVAEIDKYNDFYL